MQKGEPVFRVQNLVSQFEDFISKSGRVLVISNTCLQFLPRNIDKRSVTEPIVDRIFMEDARMVYGFASRQQTPDM